MRILVIGGTRFVGRHVVEEALGRGHEVTLLHRGQTGADLFEKAEHLTADRNDEAALKQVLDGRSFDATVDVCAYLPRQVRTLAEALGSRGGHHVYVSSVSAYAEPPEPGAGEDSPLQVLENKDDEEITELSYGPLKAECEHDAERAYGAEHLTVIRPTYVVGPWDPTGRFTYWVDRIRRGGGVLAPGPREAPVQLVDGRDQAVLVVDVAEQAKAGAFSTIGTAPPYTMSDMLDEIVATVGPDGTRLVWADADWLKERGVGAGDLPLWSEGLMEYALQMSNAAAVAAGMPVRPVTETIRDTLAWIDQQGGDVYRTPPFGAEREAALVAEVPAQPPR